VADIDFALNHMAAPRRSLRDFFALARSLNIATVEIRNDLEGRAIADGTSAGDIRAEADRAGVSIASINALYPFNIWNDERDAQARRLIDYAAACGAKGIVMCPLNDLAYRASEDERLAGMRAALRALKPMLASAGVTGLVEPLGFAVLSQGRLPNRVILERAVPHCGDPTTPTFPVSCFSAGVLDGTDPRLPSPKQVQDALRSSHMNLFADGTTRSRVELSREAPILTRG